MTEKIVAQVESEDTKNMMCVLLLSEKPPQDTPGEKYTLQGVIRLHGWNALRLDEKTITYADQMVALIDREKTESHASVGGFINLSEAIQMAAGTLDTDLSRALRSSRMESLRCVDVFFRDGKIEVLEPETMHGSSLFLIGD